MRVQSTACYNPGVSDNCEVCWSFIPQGEGCAFAGGLVGMDPEDIAVLCGSCTDHVVASLPKCVACGAIAFYGENNQEFCRNHAARTNRTDARAHLRALRAANRELQAAYEREG